MSDVFSGVREVISAGLSLAPTISTLLRGLSKVLWPDDTEEVWDQIKDDVKDAIDQAIASSYYKYLREELAGIHALLDNYLDVAQKGQRLDIQTRLEDLIARCAADMPHFQRSEYALALLPLFTQLGNIHLGALRSLGLHAREWSDSALFEADIVEFTDYLRRYSSWVTAQYETGRKRVPMTPHDPHKTTNWRAMNKYDRTMQLMVLDLQALWPSFRPDGSVPVPLLTREIYADAQGTSDESPLQTSTNADLANGDVPLTELKAWASVYWSIGADGGNTVEAVQPTYGRRLGKFMGSTKGSSGTRTFDLGATFPVVGVYIMSGSLFKAFAFLYQDGSQSGWFPSDPIAEGGGLSYWGYDGHFLSSLTIMGISSYYANPKRNVNTANCGVFGFRLLDSYATPPQKTLVFPKFERVSETTQKALPLYSLYIDRKSGYYFDYLTSMVDCGARMLDGFRLAATSPTVFILPDDSLYRDAVPIYRLVHPDEPERVRNKFNLFSYQEKTKQGWIGSGIVGYLLRRNSPAPTVAGSPVTTVPVYALSSDSEGRSMLAWSEADYQSMLQQGWNDAGPPNPVGYAFK